MGKLRRLTPAVPVLRPAIGRNPAPTYDQARDRQEWRRWYKTARWQKLRWSVLVRDLFTCQRCGTLEGDTSRLVADHKVKHGGEELRFFDADGLQTLCSPCHNSAKQKEERQAYLRP